RSARRPQFSPRQPSSGAAFVAAPPSPPPFSSMNSAPNFRLRFLNFFSSITERQFLRLRRQRKKYPPPLKLFEFLTPLQSFPSRFHRFAKSAEGSPSRYQPIGRA